MRVVITVPECFVIAAFKRESTIKNIDFKIVYIS